MLFTVLVIIIVGALIYAFTSQRGLNLNERNYLRRRGYQPPIDLDEGPPVSKDTRLLSLIESLEDVSPYSRQRAAEDLSKLCASGQRDPQMLAPLVEALDDNDASVRSAVAAALGNLGDAASIEPLQTRMQAEESIHVRASLERAIEKLRQ